MSRKRKAPKKLPIIDPKFKSTIIPKLINSIMYDGKKGVATKIVGITRNLKILKFIVSFFEIFNIKGMEFKGWVRAIQI